MTADTSTSAGDDAEHGSGGGGRAVPPSDGEVAPASDGGEVAPALDGDVAELPRLQRRTVRVLVASQVLGGIGVGSGVAVVGLLAYELSGTAALSGVSATASTLGAAVAAIVIARLSVVRGRRPGLVTGYLVGGLGAAVAVLAAILGMFWLHVVASVAFGWASASNLQARYAATDLAQPATRARSLSTIVWATTVGAVLGPNLTGPGGSVAAALSLPPLAGAYLFSFASFIGAALVQFVWLRPDPLRLVRERAAVPPVAATGQDTIRVAVATIRSIPEATVAVLAITAAHAVMVGIMVMTPVHMEHDGAALQLVGLTISLHIAGMYALSPAMGALADRFGRRNVVLFGLAQLVVAAVLAATGDPTGSVWFQGGLVLLGTGWSACLIAGSAWLTDVVPVEDRPAVQGASDLAMNLAGGVGGTLAGIVLALAGYPALALGAIVLLVPAAVGAWRLGRVGPRAGVGAGFGARPGAGSGSGAPSSA
jgi:MFS family permease